METQPCAKKSITKDDISFCAAIQNLVRRNKDGRIIVTQGENKVCETSIYNQKPKAIFPLSNYYAHR